MKLLKPFIIACVSAVVMIVFYELAQACVWVDYGESLRFSVFDPMLAPAPELRPLIFSTDKFFENYSNEIINDSVYSRNVNEWSAYTKKAAQNKDIYNVLYSIEPLKFFDTLSALEQNNSFVKFLKARDADAYGYLNYAKKCEQVINHPDPWNADDQSGGIDNAAAIRLVNEGEKLYTGTKSPFLKLHIAFQLERLFFYAGDVKGVDDNKVKVYNEKIVTSKLNSWIKGSAFYYSTIEELDSLAGYKTRAQCDYALSLAFDRAIDKRFRCVQIFTRKDLPGAMALAKNNHEKAVLSTIYQLQNGGPNLSYMQSTYTLEPNSKYLPFLLIREVNKLEDWITGNEVSGYTAPSYSIRQDITAKETEDMSKHGYAFQRKKNDIQYLNKVVDFIKQVIADGKQRDKALLKLMVTHLYVVAGDTNGASAALRDAESCALSDAEKQQITTSRLMLRIITNPAIDAETENMIMALKKPEEKKEEDYYEESMLHSVTDQVILFAGRTMMQNGNYAKGLLLLNRTDCDLGDFDWEEGSLNTYLLMHATANAKQYEEVFSLLDKKNKTPFEKYLCDKDVHDYSLGNESTWNAFNKYKVLDFEAMYYVNRDSLDNALSVLERIPDSYWKNDLYTDFEHRDPFNVEYTSLCCDSMMKSKNHGNWNKREIIKHIIELKKDAENNSAKRVADYKQIANGYYSISYYGKWWIMNNPWHSGGEPWPDKRSYFTIMYYGCTLAEKYYTLSAQGGHDFENTAFCYYMASVCREHYNQYMYYSSPRKSGDYSDYKAKEKYPYAQYMKTAFPDMVKRISSRDSTDCSYYEDFIRTAGKM